MDCPKCKIELHEKTIQGIKVEECSKCEGIWFDKDELRQVKDKTDADLNWMDFEIWKHPEKFKAGTHKYQCSQCGNTMSVLDYADTKVEIDYCAKCQSIWLDKNELEKIVNALEDDLLTKSMGDYVRATLEEAKELFHGAESFFSEWKDFTTILRFLQYRILTNHPSLMDTITEIQKNPLNR